MTEPHTTQLVVAHDGSVNCIYDEALDLRTLGRLTIKRASHVEPDINGSWWADMAPSRGPCLGPFGARSEALAAERNCLTTGAQGPGMALLSSYAESCQAIPNGNSAEQ
jgi:hypothetical protein